jgi:hypothetical protein
LTVGRFVLSIPLAAAEAERLQDKCKRRGGEEDACSDGRMVAVMMVMMMGMTVMITVSNAQHFSALSHPSCVLTLFRLSIPSHPFPSDNE